MSKKEPMIELKIAIPTRLYHDWVFANLKHISPEKNPQIQTEKELNNVVEDALNAKVITLTAKEEFKKETIKNSNILLAILKDIGKEKITTEEIYAEAEAKNISREETKEIIENLKQTGDVYEPTPGFIKIA